MSGVANKSRRVGEFLIPGCAPQGEDCLASSFCRHEPRQARDQGRPHPSAGARGGGGGRSEAVDGIKKGALGRAAREGQSREYGRLRLGRKLCSEIYRINLLLSFLQNLWQNTCCLT